MTTRCALCHAVEEQPTKERKIYDTHLLWSENFVVIPSVGPLAPGHVMVVSRDHFPNLACMGADRIQEYQSLVNRISQRKPYSDGKLLEAEHGSSIGDSGGACITHVHINLIPGCGSLVNMFDSLLPRLAIGDDLATLDPSQAPYILMRGSSLTRLYKAHEVPSQLIRRVAFERMGRSDWDWGVFPQLSVVEQTLRLWGHDEIH